MYLGPLADALGMHAPSPVLHQGAQLLCVAPPLGPDVCQPLAGAVQQRGVALLRLMFRV